MGEYLTEHYGFIKREQQPALVIFMVVGAITHKTTSVSALTLFACICTVVCFEAEAVVRRMKNTLNINNNVGTKRMVFKYRDEYEQVVNLVKITNDILGRYINAIRLYCILY